MAQQTAAPDLDREATLRVRPVETAADVDAEPGLGIAAVLVHADLDARRQARTALEAERTGALQTEPETRHLGFLRRQACRLRRARLHVHRVGLGRKLEPACLRRLHQHAAQPGRRHRQVEVGPDRRLALRGQRQRAFAVARDAPTESRSLSA